MPTIFNRFVDRKIPNGWKIYFHDMAQSATLSELWRYPDHFQLFDQFKEDAAKGPGGLPCYSFIEPRYYVPDGGLPNDQHPPHNVTLGEQLIAEIYNCLRAGPAWKKRYLLSLTTSMAAVMTMSRLPLQCHQGRKHQPRLILIGTA
jgi:phospholipase C